MKSESLTTDRLRLVPVTIETCTAELENRHIFSKLINAEVPGSWPPPLLTDETIHEFIGMLKDPDNIRLCSWYWVRIFNDPGKRDVLIGGGGLYRNDDGTCEIGYSVLDEYQSRGYATEAVISILEFIFSKERIERVYATTYPGLLPSVRVLEKCGFNRDGVGKEEGTIRFSIVK